MEVLDQRPEAADREACSFRYPRKGCGGHLPIGLPGLPCGLSEALERRGADAASGHVDHPPEREIVFRPERQTQVGQRVLDFRPLVELHAPDYHVGEPAPEQLFFERPRLRIGSVENRNLRGRAPGVSGRPDNGLRFTAIFVEAPEPDRRPLPPFREQFLLPAAAVVRDQRRGRPQNPVCRAVVPLQRDHARPWKVRVESQDVLDLRSAPAVDGLVFVADRAE